MPASLATASAFIAPRADSYCDHREHCDSCCLRELCIPVGVERESIRLLDRIATNRARLKRRDSLYRAGDAFSAVYAIRLGTFKTLMLAEDGREQITGCYMNGEIVGLDGIGDGVHTCGAVALEDSEVCVLSFDQLDQLAHHLPALMRNLYRCTSKDLYRGQEMMLLLGSMRAEERLVWFLLNLSSRYRARGYSGSEFVLRMTREEIASLLGLKLETVSRAFSRLHGEGLIQVQGRSIKLLDAPALQAMVGQLAESVDRPKPTALPRVTVPRDNDRRLSVRALSIKAPPALEAIS
jgi:CRP/FNR family transcriptional regulator